MPVIDLGPTGGAGTGGGVCEPWADVSDACAGACADYDFDPAALEDGIQAASEILFDLTRQRWSGVCTDLIRPTACGCVAYPGRWWVPEGVATPASLCGCGCGGVSEIILPAYPVVDVIEVLIDGDVVDPARYRIDDRQRLVFMPELDGTGRGAWPCCQHLSRAAGEDGTWSVEYTHGQEPPLGGVRSAASLGCQLALSCLPTDDPLAKQCRLPKRVTSITRQGLTLAIIDPLTLFKDGLTGLPEVDLWVQAVNLGVERRRGKVFVPGRKSRARRTNA